MNKIILLWISCWAVLSLLFLPFPFQFLPAVGIGLSKFILPLNEMICSLVGADVRHSFLASDSLAFYSTGLILVFLSLLITAFIHWKGKKHLFAIQKAFLFTLILFLSYFLIHYGLDKLFGVQFYTPSSNTLHTPVGQLGKDILFWTSMGTSSFYNAFMGIIEIFAGGLLLFNRTRFLGLIVGFGILLNIFAINIGFDITVKYLSGLLLISCLICICFYTSKLKLLIGMGNSDQVGPHLSQRWMLLLFLPFLVDLCATYQRVKTKDSGRSYAVESVNGTSQLINTEEIARIHFHPEGYIITESKQQEFKSYQLKNNGSFVVINQQPVTLSFQKNRLLWKEGMNEVVWKVKETDLEKIELKQDKTHWYVEEFISNR